MKILTIIFFLLTNIVLFAQTQMVINNDCYLVIDNSAFLVIDNGAANAISTVGTGGKIISEAEDDVIKWNVGTATGTHLIPWATSVATGSVKIPLTINITAGGVGAGNILLSTHETATDMNTPWQTGITNMCSSTTISDGSLLVADRFWLIDAANYTTKPTVNMTIGYNPAANELGGTNTLVETNLQAQRFNATTASSNACYTGLGSWQSLLFGTNNAASDNITNIIVSPSNFHKDWILTDKLAPLPIQLLSFESKCNGEITTINWVTATEINNDYFVIEKSYDAISFFELETVPGAGNSSSIQSYSITDANTSQRNIYYRLKQIDFDGTVEYHHIISQNCSVPGFNVNQFIISQNELTFNVLASFNENISIKLFDYQGKLISLQETHITKGENSIQLKKLNLSTGVYLLQVNSNSFSFSTKILKN